MSEVITYYLEMNSPDALNAKKVQEDLAIIEAEIKQYALNRFLYQLVGEAWQWTDKLVLTAEEWQAYAENENLRTWVAYCKGAIAGYYELQKQGDGNVEIAYFGLAPGFIGRGFGGYLLTHAIQSAWGWQGTERVWVHTCSLDHPSALANYQARGLTIYHRQSDKS
ncbi:GNAT family N-acetyltransferase [Endozoicomonas sp. Mp262]|uniref:GNAT family N-acetyltransferase n=1 Tax=Endozoicomonas sp. Mp262 TaxID=2919499 RepID=UPI0021DA6C60